MSRSVLLSIHPKYCELIASGEKTIEVRKTYPKIKPPFKCYIYCTMDNAATNPKRYLWKEDKTGRLREIYWNGKVIGEFVCNEIETYVKVGYTGVGKDPEYMSVSADFHTKNLPLEQICLTHEQFCEYADDTKVFGWHISDLVIYDELKALSEFVTEGDCALAYVNARDGASLKPIFRAPQSWRYVEELI